MIKASALYIVIIIALVIGVLCSSLMVAAYYYGIDYKKKARYDQLENHLNSGMNILLANEDDTYAAEKKISLFNTDADSVSLKSLPWGVYNIGVVKSFTQKDTLYKTFSVANSLDSSKWAALYLIDEDRPFSVSGKTTIRGDAYIPMSGVQEAYVDNKAYEGDKRLIIGQKHTSGKTLPALNQYRLSGLNQYFTHAPKGENIMPQIDSIQQSFLIPTRVFNLKKSALTLQNVNLSGNIVIYSDTTITIDNTAVLSNILVFARAIVVKSGFQGNCQLFATDSISVETNCRFTYPSCLGVLRFQSSTIDSQIKIAINDGTKIEGIVFTYEKADKPVKPIIQVGQNVDIKGQVYSQGILQLKEHTETDGSVFTSRFLYKNSFSLFENYLINAAIDSKALSPYYLTSDLMPVAAKKKKILQWLESN